MELTRPDGAPLRVLVVDDEVNLAELVSMAVRYEGWETRSAHTGSKAVAAARDFRPDAIVLDMMLPDIDGMEVLRRVRATDPLVPVLFLTARDAVEDRVAGLTAALKAGERAGDGLAQREAERERQSHRRGLRM